MESMEIDDSFFNRQRYVLGEIGMEATRTARVFLHGLGGVGVEIAKNLCLAGVKVLTVQDDRVAKPEDLGSQFFVRPDDIAAGRSRSEASLGRLAELNPYVKVERVTGDLNCSEDLSILDDFKCVVLTEYTLDLLTRCDDYCRRNNKKLIVCDVFGVFGVLFCDFGWGYKVLNTKGEEPKRFYIGEVSQANPAEVKTADNSLHGLEDGDLISIQEVKGMTELHGRLHSVTVVTPTSFTIDVDSSEFSPYDGGGLVIQRVEPQSHRDRSLRDELKCPTMEPPDLGRFSAPQELHLVHLALLNSALKTSQSREAFMDSAAEGSQVVDALGKMNAEYKLLKPEEFDADMMSRLARATAGGAALPPLCAFFGGVAAQEVLKAVSTMFAPLHQWLYLDARDLLSPKDRSNAFDEVLRYSHLRRLIGTELHRLVMAQRLFLVGCGAIGCELLKNFALLGVGAAQCGGDIVITDNDIIEKSNLNRQFLFREHHIRLPKSTIAAEATVEINPDVKIHARLDKVCEASEAAVFNDSFFESRHVCVNALDNVAARMYMDARCVTTRRPLLESGTMGTKGHVQVIVPHLTETYASQSDPPEVQFPYCTLKSFPSNLEHCIQWARDKFESQFVQKPHLLGKFVETEKIVSLEGVKEVARRMRRGEMVEKAMEVSRYLRSKCTTWGECVSGARVKFDKYFNHKARQLLHNYPLDCRLQDGSLFWQSPKRPPTPIEFDFDNELHVNFIRSCARLLAEVSGITVSPAMLETSALSQEIERLIPKPFIPSSKVIVTDEKVTRQAAEEQQRQSAEAEDAETMAVSVFESLATLSNGAMWTAVPLPFEKDDDDRGHIDFVYAAANLRAAMYSLEQADRFQVKRIAGRIVPAIATTTAAVAGLVTLELLRLAASNHSEIHDFRNAFLNLALPVFVLSEPGPCPRQHLPGGSSFSLWDRWELELPTTATVAAFLAAIESRFNVIPCSVMQGSKIVYLPFLPNHVKRLKQPINRFLKSSEDTSYYDLVITVEKNDDTNADEGDDIEDNDDEDDDKAMSCPVVRLHLKP